MRFDLTNGGGKRAYAARIIGPDPKWIFKREFLDRSKPEINTKDQRHNTIEITEDGLYELVTYSAKGNKTQFFIRLVNGERHDLTLEQVRSELDAPAQGEKPRRRSCDCTDGCCDNGCYCGSECNCKGGPIWNC